MYLVFIQSLLKTIKMTVVLGDMFLNPTRAILQPETRCKVSNMYQSAAVNSPQQTQNSLLYE